MDEFVPAQKERYAAGTMALLELIYSAPEDYGVWLAAVSSYMTSYPYQILIEFAKFALTEDQVRAAKAFALRDRAKDLPEYLKRAAACKDRKACADFVLWLGTVYAFDLVRKFHLAVN